jgi:tRNA nucleotidyltransferase/poly(A) polymerase
MSDYNFLMESRLSPEQYAVIGLISRLAAENSLNLYLVGGAVRDLTFGQQVVRDLDFAVEGSPQKILRALPVAGSTKPTGAVHGAEVAPVIALDHQVFDERLNAAELRFANGVRAELAMCREETYTRPGQRPEITPATIFEDLKRRDFAFNAMAVSLHPNSRGLLLDPTNGAGDMERRELRTLHPRSFSEDPSRIFRALRLGMRLDFKPDERTQRWLDQAVTDGAWERLDSEQQARELADILHEDQPGRVLKMLAERKLLAGLDTKLASAHLPYERFARVRSVLQSVPGADAFLLNFHFLVEKLGGEHTARLAKKIIGDSKAIKLALSLDHDSKKLEHILATAQAEQPSQVYALLAPQPQPLLLYLLASTKSAKVQNRIKSHLFKFPLIRARLPRTELQSLGVKPGPEFDRIIEEVFARQLDGKIKTHQQLMKEMRELAGIKEPPPPPPPPPAPVSRKGKGAVSTPAGALPGKKGKGKPDAAAAPPADDKKGGPVPPPSKKGREAAPVPAKHAEAVPQAVVPKSGQKSVAEAAMPVAATSPEKSKPPQKSAKPVAKSKEKPSKPAGEPAKKTRKH